VAWIFSKRCKKALADNRIRVSIPRPTRIRILAALQEFDFEYRDSDGSLCDALQDLSDGLRSELGIADLMAYPEDGSGAPEPSNLEGFILRGNYPPYLLDSLELYYNILPHDSDYRFQQRINEIMEESSLEWRMALGKLFPVDSTYIEEVVQESTSLLFQSGFEGALEEFEKARADVVNAHIPHPQPHSKKHFLNR
jgi:hypothetical protein